MDFDEEPVFILGEPYSALHDRDSIKYDIRSRLWITYRRGFHAIVSVGTFTYESGPLEYEEFPLTEEPVFILGEPYSALHDRDSIKYDIRSRLWITYRRGFHAIGGTGPATDQGWGCMLRCGQMMMAQALVLHHLGRQWRWQPCCSNEKYWKILRMFEDRKMATYSIHQIASMGEAEGKAVGQWFGPNTIAQVLKRIAVYDEWSKLVIHVALDNVVILDDILKLCKPQPGDSESELHPSGAVNGEAAADKFLPEGEKFSHFVNDSLPQTESQKLRSRPYATGGICNGNSSSSGADSQAGDDAGKYTSRASQAEKQGCNRSSNDKTKTTSSSPSSSSSSSPPSSSKWKPLVLFIPLRLGLTEINPIYFDSLRKCFAMKQSIGIIGGKPNHAHWFIGYVGKELIYLDPHTNQNVVDLDSRSMSSDLSYHCVTPPSRMSFSKLDPSIALGFYCATEKDLTDLCLNFSLQDSSCRSMFEVREHAPEAWPSLGCEGLTAAVTPPQRTRGISLSDFATFDGLIGVGSSVDDEEFEMI
ncbi:cysteine protease [Plakobranchus ocellatus]|uniref:Cysteine protease n=1 Tax=Plakobranchus ocellatus TaxID=259542 RepID=A0AAV3ZJM9_9GAST|nr:cysteine protease [Plakobranchus ocellatus]